MTPATYNGLSRRDGKVAEKKYEPPKPQESSETDSMCCSCSNHPHRTWGRLLGTVVTCLDFIACFSILPPILLIYWFSSDRNLISPNENSIGGPFWLWELIDTVLPFYCARGVQITIDFHFRCWEGVLSFRPFGIRFSKHDSRENHRKMLVIKEWANAIGKIISTALFFRLYWGKAGWWTQTAMNNWKEGYPRLQT